MIYNKAYQLYNILPIKVRNKKKLKIRVADIDIHVI